MLALFPVHVFFRNLIGRKSQGKSYKDFLLKPQVHLPDDLNSFGGSVLRGSLMQQ